MFSSSRTSLLSLLLAAPLCAQTYTAHKIVFKHPGAFTQAQLEDASGLHPGMKVTGEDVGAASQKLADSQYFDSVTAAMEAPPSGLVITFDLKPSPAVKFLPVGFENFVWLTPAEINTAIVSKVPLYNGTMVEGSSSVDDASSALQAALAAKGVQAKVTCDSVEPSLHHPLRVLEFRIEQPNIQVANVQLSGVQPSMASLLQTAVSRTTHTAYNAGRNGVLTSDRILESVLNAGYVRATLQDATATPGTANGSMVPITFHATLDAGEIYKVGTVTFSGSPLYSADQFAKTSQMKPGDTASEHLLLESLKPLRDAYLEKGYLDVAIDTHPTFDDAAKTVSYAITVTPGEPYLLHEITTQGLDDPAAQADFKRGFSLKPGSPYNPIYVKSFIKANTALQAFKTYTGLYKATAYPATHTVDLQLVFAGNSVNAR